MRQARWTRRNADANGTNVVVSFELGALILRHGLRPHRLALAALRRPLPEGLGMSRFALGLRLVSSVSAISTPVSSASPSGRASGQGAGPR